MFLMALNGFIYTIAVYFMPFISHLAAFSTAFSTILPCI